MRYRWSIKTLEEFRERYRRYVSLESERSGLGFDANGEKEFEELRTLLSRSI